MSQFITNFAKEQEQHYRAAIAKHPNFGLHIKREAFTAWGGVVPDCYSLHRRDGYGGDLGLFWNTFHFLKTGMYKIVTHDGQAHLDDFLACAFIVGDPLINVESISRQSQVYDSDINSPYVYVLDVGGKHDAELLNFDHHQFDRDAIPQCAFSLVLKARGLYHDVKDLWPWLSPTEINDCKGPKAFQEYFGAKKSLIGAKSPIEKFILAEFSKHTGTIYSSWPIFKLMQEFGASLHNDLLRFKERRKEWDAVSVVTIDGITSIDVSHLYAGNDNPLFGAEPFLRGKDVNVLISQDDRGEGFSVIRRQNAATLLDFSKVEHHPLVSFAHKDGFVMKVKPSATSADIQKLLVLSKI